jgi:tetratricopeptide (TPR) repeat protein
VPVGGIIGVSRMYGTRQHTGQSMKSLNSPIVICLSTIVLLAGCTVLQIGSSIQQGRTELKRGNPDRALVHFQRVAELDPNYMLNFTLLRQGVWTYVGRAYYGQGKLPEAGRALEKARSRHPDDDLAKLYMGLVLARKGDRETGVREIEAGLHGLGNWLNDLDQNHQDGPFWDPGRNLRNQMQQHLAMISGRDIDWRQLISGVERLGNKFEEEIDRARRDKKEDLYRRNGGTRD